MSKIGVNISIDVTKLNKQLFVKGTKGTYANLTVFIDPDNKDQYGNNGGVKQDHKDADSKQQPFIGNARVFWQEPSQQQPGGFQQPQFQPQQQGFTPQQPQQQPDFDPSEDIPF